MKEVRTFIKSSFALTECGQRVKLRSNKKKRAFFEEERFNYFLLACVSRVETLRRLSSLKKKTFFIFSFEYNTCAGETIRKKERE